MSNLTQFVGGGDSYLGEYIPQIANDKPFNFTVGAKEYLRTSFFKEYNSNYAEFAAAVPIGVANTAQDTLHSQYEFPNYGGHWNYAGGFNYPEMFELGFDSASGLSYKHVFYVGSHYSGYAYPMHHYGVNLANPKTGSSGDYWGSVYGVNKINSRLIVAGYLPSCDTDATGRYFGWCTSSAANSPTFNTGFLARPTYDDTIYPTENAQAALLYLHESYGNGSGHANSVYYTTNATSIVTRTPNVDIRYPRRITWSQLGNRFVVVKNNGTIFTTTDGSSFTTISAASITGANGGVMPTDVSWQAGHGQHCVDHPVNGTMIMLGSYTSGASGVSTGGLYVLKTTNGTSFTIENLAANNPQLNGFFAAVGTTGPRWSIPRLFFNGTHLIMYSQNTIGNDFMFYSTDWGATWAVDRYLYNQANTGRQSLRGLAFFNSNMYALFASRESYGDGTAKLYSVQGRRFGATPQLVGTPNAYAWASGSSFSTYQRIK